MDLDMAYNNIAMSHLTLNVHNNLVCPCSDG